MSAYGADRATLDSDLWPAVFIAKVVILVTVDAISKLHPLMGAVCALGYGDCVERDRAEIARDDLLYRQ